MKMKKQHKDMIYGGLATALILAFKEDWYVRFKEMLRGAQA